MIYYRLVDGFMGELLDLLQRQVRLQDDEV